VTFFDEDAIGVQLAVSSQVGLGAWHFVGHRDRFDLGIRDVPCVNIVRMERLLPNDTPGRHRARESVAAGGEPGT
jgi:hypothetical protein